MTPDFGKPPAIPPGSLILVTGANGFIGSHVTDQLIQAGYRVRGTTRDASKADWMKEMFGDKFEAVVVKDMAEDGAFDEACQGVSGVAHVASILTFDPDPYKVIPDTIKGAVNAATSASKQSSIKRFVYTSSSTAITKPYPNKEFTISTDNWNTEEVEAAWKPPPYEPERAWAVYGASKTQAEQKMWEFYKDTKPGFVLNTVLPNANMGTILSGKQPASTGNWAREVYKGNLDVLKPLSPQWMVNVKDTARLHVAALIDPDVEEQRLLAFAEPFNWNAILACLRRIYPGKKFPDDIENEPRDLSKVDTAREASLLRKFGRPGFTSMEESVRENTAGL